MAIAARVDSSLAATITQSNLVAAIKSAMLSAGLTLFDEFTSSTDNILIYEHINDSTKTYGKVYLRIKVTSSLVISQQLFSGWNASTDSGSNAGTETTYTAFATNASINFSAFNGNPEIKTVIITQNTNYVALGLLMPATRPNFWDMNQWSWGFYPASVGFLTLRSSSLNPFSNDGYSLTFATAAIAAGANPQTNKRDVLTGMLIYSNTNNGIAGKTSDDVAVVYGSGTSRFDTIQPTGTTQIFTILNNTAGGFALRTT